MERFSMKEVLKAKYGEVDKNTKVTKRATKKTTNDSGKYITKIVDGVKYMKLK